ncbi:MAG: SMC family ATPase, partial [Proteiniphilum sp.]|nr:SMC family ATPase [Proteiniphilum sp.]
ALDEFKRTEAELSTKIASNISYLKALKFEDYKEHKIGDITKIIFALKEKNDSTERQYKILNSDITDIDKTIASQKTSVDSLLKRIKITKDIVSELTNDMESKLYSEGYESAKSVEDILSQKIDVAKERAVINKFTIEFETLKNQIKDLEDKLAKEEYDNSKFEEQEIAWHTSKHKLDESNNRMIKLKSDLERLNKLLAEKKELIKEQELLSKRADNLRIMTNLFKAQGFVQYVSSIYLAQLCDHANERFRRMTRNQLRLQINENNDFEIVDYLNEGRSRSVKTLSGGQAFQVSLSLALALAESVQTNAKADKNFFFIDEGFGTQDSDSVNIVFETLLNLNKENKIVGIISHVEELKERIPMTLTVIKDQERGSLIR